MASSEYDQNFKNLLRVGDNKAFELLYREHYHKVCAYVLNNQGNFEDAKEVFQDTMIVLFKKVREDDFVLTVQWGTYIYAIAHNVWLKKLREDKQMKIVQIEEMKDFVTLDIDINLYENQYEQKHNIVSEVLSSMKHDCREIIDAAFYKKLSGISIATLLGYSEDFVKVKKYRCMQELKNLVKSHALFNN